MMAGDRLPEKLYRLGQKQGISRNQSDRATLVVDGLPFLDPGI
jgi:hypothetical protein